MLSAPIHFEFIVICHASFFLLFPNRLEDKELNDSYPRPRECNSIFFRLISLCPSKMDKIAQCTQFFFRICTWIIQKSGWIQKASQSSKRWKAIKAQRKAIILICDLRDTHRHCFAVRLFWFFIFKSFQRKKNVPKINSLRRRGKDSPLASVCWFGPKANKGWQIMAKLIFIHVKWLSEMITFLFCHWHACEWRRWRYAGECMRPYVLWKTLIPGVGQIVHVCQQHRLQDLLALTPRIWPLSKLLILFSRLAHSIFEIWPDRIASSRSSKTTTD